MQTLEITQVQVFPLPHEQGKLKAYARVILAEQIQLTSLRIYEGSLGLFVSYPNDPHHKGEDYRQLYYPVTRELRDAIEQAVLAEWERMTKPKTVRVTRKRIVTEYVEFTLPSGIATDDTQFITNQSERYGLSSWDDTDTEVVSYEIKEVI